MKNMTTTQKITIFLLTLSILLNLFLLSSLPNRDYIKILQKIADVEKSGKRYINPAESFRFRAPVGLIGEKRDCMRDGKAKLIQTTIDYKGRFVYATFQCEKENFTQEMNVALSLHHEHFNVYIATKDSDLNTSIGEIAPVPRVDMGI